VIRRLYLATVVSGLCATLTGMALLAAPSASAAVQPAPNASAASAASAARFASEATAYQNKIIAGMLSRVPGGTRVAPGVVKWPDGVTMGVAASSDADTSELDECLDYYAYPSFCGFTEADYEGEWLSVPDVYGWFYWGAYIDAGMHSYFNGTPYRVWREQFQNSGNELCIDPLLGISGGNDYYNTDYDGADLNDYWILISRNADNC
jgi:hypothetical protein